MGRTVGFFVGLLGLVWGTVSAQAPNPQIRLEVDPQNATTAPFAYRSVVNPGGATLESHRVVVEYEDRAGRRHTWEIARGRSTTLSGSWILRNSSLSANPINYQAALASLSYGGYRGRDGTLHSAGGYAPGVYTFRSEATLSYREGRRVRWITVRSDSLVRSVLYAGTTNAQTLRNLFYYSQRIWMEKKPFEWGGQIDGPYSPNPDTRSRPWIGGIFLGFQSGSVLDRYFRNYGLKGYLAVNSRFEDTPTCREGTLWIFGGEICSTFEAYDPDWIVGQEAEKQRGEALAYLRSFTEGYAGDFTGRPGLYWYRGLSRVFSPGEYDPKGFLLFQTPHRDYLFFSQTGKFLDGESLLVIELPPGLASTFRAVLRWGELKRQLPECKPEGCPETPPSNP